MANNLNQTQNVSNTQNPQGAITAPGASDAADFQAPAGQDALNTQTESLSVQDTGDPITGSSPNQAEGMPLGWVLVIILGAVVAVVVIVKMIRDMMAEDALFSRTSRRSVAPSAPARSTPARKKTTTKSASRTGKKKPAKKSAKRSTKRR